MKIFAPYKFRHLGVDYQAGWFNVPDLLGSELILAGYVLTTDDPTVDYLMVSKAQSMLSIDGRTGPLVETQYLKQKLPAWSAAKRKADANVANANVCIIGDSTSLGMTGTGSGVGSYASRLAKLISDAANGNAATKWGNAGYKTGTSSLSGYDSRFGAIDDTTYQSRGALAATYPLGNSELFVGRNGFFSTTPTAPFTPETAIDTLDVYYLESNSYGKIGIYEANGTLTTIDCHNALSSNLLKKATITLSKLSRDPISFTKPTSSGNGVTYTLGLVGYDSSVKSVIYHATGIFGGTSAILGSTVQPWSSLNQIKAIGPDLSVIVLGLNDAFGSVSSATFQTNMQAIIDGCLLTGDVVIATPTLASASAIAQVNQDTIKSGAKAVAATNSLHIVYLGDELVSYDYQNSLGNMSADGIHFSGLAGYQAVANQLIATGIFSL